MTFNAAWALVDAVAAPLPQAPPATRRRLQWYHSSPGDPAHRPREVMERETLSVAATGRGDNGRRSHSHTLREVKAPRRLHVGLGEEKYYFEPRSALWRREAHTHTTNETSRDWSLSVPQSSVVDFWVQRSEEEQEMVTPHPTGGSGLTAEEE